MAYARKLPSGRFRAIYCTPRSRTSSAGTYPSYDAALKAAVRAEDRARRGEHVDSKRGRTTFSPFAVQHVENRDYGDEATRDRDASLLRNHFGALGDLSLASIRPEDLRRWYRELPLSHASAVLARQLLGRVLAEAETDGLIARSPARSISWSQATTRHRVRRADRWLTRDELHALAEAIEPRYRAVILGMGYMGWRPGETAGLTRDQVDLLHGAVNIAYSLQERAGHLRLKEPKTPAALRTLRLPNVVRDALEQHLADYPSPPFVVATEHGSEEHSFMFTGRDGAPLRKSWVRRFFRPAAEVCGIFTAPRKPNLRPHHLRHTCASLLIDQGIDAKLLQEWLGHSSYAVTMDVYAHLYPEAQERIVAALDEIHESPSRAINLASRRGGRD